MQLSAFKTWKITDVLKHDIHMPYVYFRLQTVHCLRIRNKSLVLVVTVVYWPLVLRISWISYILNADGRQYINALTSCILCWWPYNKYTVKFNGERISKAKQRLIMTMVASFLMEHKEDYANNKPHQHHFTLAYHRTAPVYDSTLLLSNSKCNKLAHLTAHMHITKKDN